MLRIAAFTGGINVPSARFRVRQYIPRLREEGLALFEIPSRFGAYPPRAFWRRPLWGISTLASQIPKMVTSHRYDAVLLQRELISTLVTLEPFMKKPRVLDVDDAIFLFRNGRAARRIAELSDLIICGNNYLADWFGRWNRRVVVIPTAVDSGRFVPKTKLGEQDGELIIGWIGTSSNLRYLANIEPALARVMGEYPKLRLNIVCDRVPELRSLPSERVDFHRWSEENEVARIQHMDIGLMPMDDTAWSRGKCAYKMLQYLSCGVPVVVSPIGMNAEVLANGKVGLAAENIDQWVSALLFLLRDKTERILMGQKGRELVLDGYSIDVVVPKLGAALFQVTKAR